MILQEEEGSSDSFQEHLRGSGSTGEWEEIISSNGGALD